MGDMVPQAGQVPGRNRRKMPPANTSGVGGNSAGAPRQLAFAGNTLEILRSRLDAVLQFPALRGKLSNNRESSRGRWQVQTPRRIIDELSDFVSVWRHAFQTTLYANLVLGKSC